MAQGIPGQRVGVLRTDRQVLASLKGVILERGTIDATNSYDGANTNYERELNAGWLMARVTSTKKWVPCKRTSATTSRTASTSLVVTNAAAFRVGDTVTIGGNQAFRIGVAKHNASAASAGTLVYISINADGSSPYGQLQSANAGTADSFFDVGASGGRVRVEYIASPATNAFQVYYNESATNPDERFLANVTGLTRDIFVRVSDGRFIRVKHDASASSNGVALYFADAGSTVSERLLYVSPTTSDSQYWTDRTSTSVIETNFVTRSTGNAITAINYSTNTLTITSAIWAAGDAVICDSLAGSETPRAILNEFVDLIDDDAVARDKQTGNLVFSGYVYSGQVLGDLAACRLATNFLSQLSFDDQQGAT